MKHCFEVCLQRNQVGTVTVEKSGLYYLLSCRCNIPCDRFYRLIAYSGERRLSLGFCVPECGKSVLRCRLPIKQIDFDHLRFALEEGNVSQLFVPICADKPFPHLDRLPEGKLAEQDGVMGVLFTELPKNSDHK